jgi:tetratricopeptide (TPR) repeat protein
MTIGNRARSVGDRAGALASYEAAAAADPQRPGVLVDIASVLRELGRLDEAEAALQRLLAVEPLHFGGLVERGHVLRRRGDRAGALASYEAAAAAGCRAAGRLGRYRGEVSRAGDTARSVSDCGGSGGRTEDKPAWRR